MITAGVKAKIVRNSSLDHFRNLHDVIFFDRELVGSFLDNSMMIVQMNDPGFINGMVLRSRQIRPG